METIMTNKTPKPDNRGSTVVYFKVERNFIFVLLRMLLNVCTLCSYKKRGRSIDEIILDHK